MSKGPAYNIITDNYCTALHNNPTYENTPQQIQKIDDRWFDAYIPKNKFLFLVFTALKFFEILIASILLPIIIASFFNCIENIAYVALISGLIVLWVISTLLYFYMCNWSKDSRKIQDIIQIISILMSVVIMTLMIIYVVGEPCLICQNIGI